MICPRGSLGICINLQISRPVLLAWAVIANLFLLDGGAWRCLMSRLGLYLSTREYAGLLPDCTGLRDLFLVGGQGSLWVLFLSLKAACTLNRPPRRTPPTQAELSPVTISPRVVSSSPDISPESCPQKELLECSFVILLRTASEQLKCKHFSFLPPALLLEEKQCIYR